MHPCKIVALAFACGVACGGQVEEETGPGSFAPAPFEPPPPDAVPIEASLLPVLEVPGGLAWVGRWSVQTPRPHFRPADCSGTSDGSLQLRVGAFRLMETEVTNAAYARCVDTGSCVPPAELTQATPAEPTLGDWRDPTRARDAALVDYFQARAFCRHYGGDLPTYGEWARAISAGADGFGTPAISEAYYECEHGSSDAYCSSLLAESEQSLKLPIKRAGNPLTYEWDVGPYGHRAMTGGAAEWVRSLVSRGFPYLSSQCGKILDDAGLYHDPDASESGLRMIAMMPLDGLVAARALPNGYPDTISAAQFLDPHEARYFTGFRCAFPEDTAP